MPTHACQSVFHRLRNSAGRLGRSPLRRSLTLAATALLAGSLTGAAQAASPRIIELFTSHGCSSCPPADALLGKLIDADPELVALEWHVDYWNQLVHGSDGNWVDPYSSRAYTQRQQYYNQVPLAGRQGVYTPQAIINGNYAAVGSDQRRIVRALSESGPDDVMVSLKRNGNTLTVQVEGKSRQAADVMLISFIKQATTQITAGENADRSITNHHIVTSAQSIGTLSDSGYSTHTVEHESSPERGCAILVQSRHLGPILGASLCP